MWERFGEARARRAHRYSPEGLSAKLEAAKQKRLAAWAQAREQEEQMLERLEERRVACEERLEARRIENEEKVERQRAQAQADFQKRQVMIHAKTTEWVENKLEEHAKYKAKCEAARDTYKGNMKEKSKSTGDIRGKAWQKVKANKDKLTSNQNESNANLMARHAAADQRREDLNSMKLKNENDIYSYAEIKHHSFGELCRRRNAEIKKRTDAQLQALVYDLAEKQAKMGSKTRSLAQLRDARQRISKESLTFQDNANEGFLKIQSEPDENKVIMHMNALGFDMPKLPEKDDGPEEEENTKAF